MHAYPVDCTSDSCFVPVKNFRARKAACVGRWKKLGKVSTYRPHLPESCPPGDAVPSEGIFFRLILDGSVCEQSFLSLREKDAKRKIRPPRTECEACGLSLYRTLTDAANLKKANPGTFGKALIAQGNLDRCLGTMKPTPARPGDSHTTYWPFASSEPWQVFSLISEGEGNE